MTGRQAASAKNPPHSAAGARLRCLLWFRCSSAPLGAITGITRTSCKQRRVTPAPATYLSRPHTHLLHADPADVPHLHPRCVPFRAARKLWQHDARRHNPWPQPAQHPRLSKCSCPNAVLTLSFPCAPTAHRRDPRNLHCAGRHQVNSGPVDAVEAAVGEGLALVGPSACTLAHSCRAYVTHPTPHWCAYTDCV